MLSLISGGLKQQEQKPAELISLLYLSQSLNLLQPTLTTNLERKGDINKCKGDDAGWVNEFFEMSSSEPPIHTGFDVVLSSLKLYHHSTRVLTVLFNCLLSTLKSCILKSAICT